jgi:mycothiol synthase
VKIEALGMDKVKDFADYCRKHKSEVDESFIYEEDLRDFNPDNENPTYIITNLNEEITGAASLDFAKKKSYTRTIFV